MRGATEAAVVTVLGAGTMGAGIAQACVLAGNQVHLVDAELSALERGETAVRTGLERLVQKAQLDAAGVERGLALLLPTTDLPAAVAAAEVIIEAVTEHLEVKRSLWRLVGAHARPGSLLTTNTSSLSVTEIAAFGPDPAGTCGLHFFNPVAVLPLVEVVRGERSSEATIERAVAFATAIGKTPIVCRDTPGFVVNRLLIPYVNDAVQALDEGVVGARDMDAAMTLGANLPIGPLALADLIGLDVTLAAIEALHRETGDPRYRPAPLLRRMVRAGKLGRKSGEGFHRYA